MLFLKINSDNQSELTPWQEHQHNTARGKILLQFCHKLFSFKKTVHETVLKNIKIRLWKCPIRKTAVQKKKKKIQIELKI